MNYVDKYAKATSLEGNRKTLGFYQGDNNNHPEFETIEDNELF
jgi:hypothetical protein